MVIESSNPQQPTINEINPQFLEWEKEEQELYNDMMLKKIKSIKDEDGIEGLPRYMLEILEECSDTTTRLFTTK